jgi:parallel beta-helix repeat protein
VVALLMIAPVRGDVLSAPRTVDHDARWTGEVLVSDDVTVRTGVTLTVEHANLRFASRAALTVHGRLVAKDSSFSSAHPDPSPSDWRGVTIARQPGAFLPPVQPASSIERCTIEYARAALTISGAGMTPPLVRNNTIRQCGWAGIVASGLDELTIADNTLTAICSAGPADQGRAIAITDCTRAQICGNTIRDVSDTAVFLERSNDCRIEKNTSDRISGGPGPGPAGFYRDWAFAVVLLDSDRNRVAGNTFTHTGYQGVLVAYGSDQNSIEDNVIEWCLCAINVLGDGRNNVFRRNRVNGGWTVLYHNGPGPSVFEQCNIDGGGGACFTVRTGSATFRDCTWKNTNGMNAWGGDIAVERCTLTDISGGATLSLQNDANITLTDCDLDWSRVRKDPKFTGQLQQVPNR